MKYSVIKSYEGFFKIVSKTEFEKKCKQFEEYLEKVLPFGLNLTKFLAPNCEVKFDKEKFVDKRCETSICYYAVDLRLICKGDLNEISRKQIYHLWSNDLVYGNVQKAFEQYNNKTGIYKQGTKPDEVFMSSALKEKYKEYVLMKNKEKEEKNREIFNLDSEIIGNVIYGRF